jgi:large subunit ribosomal protein L32
MAVPQRRISKTRKRLRRTHFKLNQVGLVTCPKCGAMIKSHHVCPKCGSYDGKVVYLKGKKVEDK